MWEINIYSFVPLGVREIRLADLQTSITDLYHSTFCPVRACGAYLISFSLLYFFLRNALAVDGAPGEDDVGEDERDEEGNYRHGTERELATATVGEGERTLKVDVRRIVGGIVPAGYQQQNQHGEHGSDARKPDSLSVVHASRWLENAEKYEYYTY